MMVVNRNWFSGEKKKRKLEMGVAKINFVAANYQRKLKYSKMRIFKNTIIINKVQQKTSIYLIIR